MPAQLPIQQPSSTFKSGKIITDLLNLKFQISGFKIHVDYAVIKMQYPEDAIETQYNAYFIRGFLYGIRG